MATVLAPTFFVKIKPTGEAPIRVNISERMLSMEYEDHEKKADRLRMVLDNRDLAHFDDPILKKGNLITVSWGYPGNFSPPREVSITKISGFTNLTVEALDKGILLNKKGRGEVYENATRAEVAQIIAERNGYGTEEQHIQDTGIVYPTIVQARRTDAQMLARLARKEGYEFYIDFDGFHFHERVLDQPPVRKYVYYNSSDNESGILSLNVKNDVYAKPGTVKVKCIDPDSKQVCSATGDNDETKRKGLGEKTELYTLRRNKDKGIGLEVNAVEVERPVAGQGGSADADAKREADRRFKKATQTTVKISMVVIGDPSLLAKTVIRLEGIGKRLTGNYYVRAVKHSIGAQGYTTSLELLSDGHRGYVQPGDILLAEDRGKPVDPENKADKNDKDTVKPHGLIQRNKDTGTVDFIDVAGRQNLPGAS